MSEMLLGSAWLGPLLWGALYVSDNLLTIACARLYQAQDRIVFEGSYEITPMYQADVNALRRTSPRFWVVLLLSTGYVVLVQRLAVMSSGFASFYALVLGALLLLQLTVHVRHLRNWFLFRYGATGIRGRVEYARGLMLRASALEMLAFAALYSALFVLTASMFILGGALACAVLAANHHTLARRWTGVQSEKPLTTES
jgi:hypothetical protein